MMIRFFPTQISTTKLQYEEKFLQKLNAKCLADDNSSCIMAKLLNYMNKMIKKSSFSVSKRITLQQTRSVWLFSYSLEPLNMLFASRNQLK